MSVTHGLSKEDVVSAVCCRCDPVICEADDSGEHCMDQACGYCLHGCPATDVPCCQDVDEPRIEEEK